MLSGCLLSPQVLPFGAKNESHDNEHRRQLEITLKFSRRATFRFPQGAGHHDDRRHPLRNKGRFSLRRRAQEYCFDFRSERGEVSMEKFITNGAILGGAVRKIVGLPLRRFVQLWTEEVCLIMDRSCQRDDYLFAIELAPVLRFRTTPNPHTRCSGPIISSWSKDKRKAATR
jgi:hypothetical protein